jgi:hypothetical protein
VKSSRVATIAALLLVFYMVDAVAAEPRGPLPARADEPKSPEEHHSEAMVKMETWLRRLVGRYYMFSRIAVDGVLKNDFKDGRRPDGTVATRFLDCVGIGSGPGVLCTMYSVVHKPDQEISYRFIMLVEFGLDKNASKIRVLMVASDGSVGESTTELTGDTASWLGMSCPSTRMNNLRCKRTMKITAPADVGYFVFTYGQRLGWRFEPERVGSGTVYWYRLSPQEGNGPDGLPRTMADPLLDIDADRHTRPGPR